MNKDTLLQLIENKKSSREIASALNISTTSVYYWLNKYDLKTYYSTRVIKSDTRECTHCNTIKPLSEFGYKNAAKTRQSFICRCCVNAKIRLRAKSLKLLCVSYKGGKCNICSYNRCLYALEFHHINQNEKEFEITGFKSTSLTAKLRNELDKCVLLCANCHREAHFGTE